MPRGDRTGPTGAGPRTGRGAGYCAGYDNPGSINRNTGYGRGFIRGGRYSRCGGRGWRNRYYATGVHHRGSLYQGPIFSSEEHESAWLKEEAEWLKGQLDSISERLSFLEKGDKSKDKK